MAETLLDKVWRAHTVRELPDGQTQLFIGLHLLHEVTSPQAFAMLRDLGLQVRHPERTFATMDHVVPTEHQARPFADALAEEMAQALADNCRRHGIRFFDLDGGEQGVIHIIGPEKGLTQPGMTIACGDSHTATHGAVGALAFGIGTSQIRDVLATQCVALAKPKLRRIRVEGELARGVYPKDLILTLIGRLGVKGGVGFAYEYAGGTFERMDLEGRLTVCNMSIEGGARFGYVNPDAATARYLEGREFAPRGAALEQARVWWRSMASDPGARYDDEVLVRADEIAPMVTWGINPGQVAPVTGTVPRLDQLPAGERAAAVEALAYMQLREGQPLAGLPINVAFIGSCTNGRIGDLRAAAAIVRGQRVAKGVRALVVPGSIAVGREAVREGLDEVFRAAGFEWRLAGCSLCLAMNPDKLVGDQLCAAASNRNFKGRMGSPTGRTLLMSPAMVAAAAVAGQVVDVRTAR